MANHKDASEVSIVPRGEEKSGFALWIEKNGVMLFVGLLLIAGVVLVKSQMSASSLASEREDWATLNTSMQSEVGGIASLRGASIDGLANSSEQLKGSPVAGAWARYAYATRLGLDGEYAKASAEVARLQADFPGHSLNKDSYTWSDGSERTLPEQMRRIYDDQAQWRTAHSSTLSNEEPPADAPVVLLETSAGTIEIALYPNLAPEHVANFLKLADEDFYIGTNFHRVVPGFMIQGGDPNTKPKPIEPLTDEEIERRASMTEEELAAVEKADEAALSGTGDWGEGGPDYTINHESSSLKHFTGYLAAAKKGTGIEESGSQFYITTGTPHHLNGKHTVYGKVISGMEIVTVIEQGETGITGGSIPTEPVVIMKVSRK